MKNTKLFHWGSLWLLAGLAPALFASAAFAQEVVPSSSVAVFPHFLLPASFASTNSVSDILGVAHDTDLALVNPWGFTIGPDGNLHINNNGTGVNGFYSPEGYLLPSATSSALHTYAISQATITSGTVGSPTGIVLNRLGFTAIGSNDFMIPRVIPVSGTSGPSHYLIATEDGAICGYNETVDAANTVKAYDGSANGAGYTGLALSFVSGTDGVTVTDAAHHRLYAANFRAGKIDVFDSNFTPVTLTGSNTFTDPNLPPLPAGRSWSPFNVHNIAFVGAKGKTERRILVAYAVHSTTNDPMDDIPSAGSGAVAVFMPNGEFVEELVPPGELNNLQNGQFIPEVVPANGLNSPWGLAIDHTPFAKVGAHAVVLVGNHGDGTINAFAFDAASKEGMYLGVITNNEGNPLAFDGLWALHFGPKKVQTLEQFRSHPDVDELSEDGETLFFSAGILGESHGLVGKIVVPKFK